MTHFKRILSYAIAGIMVLQFAACGVAGESVGNVSQGAEESAVQESGETAEKTVGTSENDGAPANTDGIVGEWVMVYEIHRSVYEEEEPYEYVTMCDDYYAPESELRIRKDGEKLVADYKNTYEMGVDRFYGNELIYRAEPAYEGCENSDWSYALSMPFDDDEEKIITLTDADTLVRYEAYETDPEEMSEDYYYYRNETRSVYLRKDSPRLENPEKLRYFKTVTVSNAQDLLKNIANNTKIILEAGTYDFTDISFEELDNPYVNMEYGEYHITASNQCLEAKDGAEVLICVADPCIPVLAFEYSNNVTLRGLTVGHDVEPGYCSGSVLDYSGVGGITIENCKLYGSGTYGVRANSCSFMNVTDTEIYECTYGLVSLSNINDALFKNCEMRDSEDMAMFDLWSVYGVVFEDCKIHDNVSSQNSEGIFVRLGDEYGDVTFRNCDFSNNSYTKFSDYSVTLEKCSVNDNVR